MIAIAWLSAAGPPGQQTGALEKTPSFADVQNVVFARCSMCHTQQPMWPGIAAAPRGVRLDSPEAIKLHASMIAINAVDSHAMPPGNITEISPQERQVLAAWIAAGAPTK
jgi:uncharacterized membrane protein